MSGAAEHPNAATDDSNAANNDTLRDEALALAAELAPNYDRLTNVARAVNDALDVDWTLGKWRGFWKDYPSVAERVRKRLGTAQHEYRRNIVIEGDTHGIVLSDVHAPFHDRNAINLACKIIRWWKPKVVIWNGDNADFYGASRYDKNPARSWRLQEEIDTWHIECVAPVQAAQVRGTEEYFLPGNHEARLWHRLWQNPDLFGIRSLELPELFELKRYGIKYASESIFFGDELEVTHGDRVSKWAGMSAKAEQEKRRFAIKTITGHVHRAGFFNTRVGGRQVWGQEAPCLCSLQPEYMRNPDWVQGVTLFAIKKGVAHRWVVPFESDYTAMVGKEYFEL